MKRLNKDIQKPPKQKFYSNRLHMLNAMAYIIIVYCFAFLASHYSYTLERNAILQNNHEVTNEIYRYYENKQDNFWIVFHPAFQKTEYYQSITRFMTVGSGDELADPILRGSLVELLNLSAVQDPDISWILLHRKGDRQGYVFNPYTKTISETSPDFPYLSQLKDKRSIRQLYGARAMTLNKKNITVYGIAGAAYSQSLGSLLVGYNLEPLNEIYRRYTFRVPTQILILTLDGEVVYDSGNQYYGAPYHELPLKNAKGKVTNGAGKEYYAETIMRTNHNYMVSYVVSWRDLNRAASKNTLAIMGTCTLFALMSAVLQIFAGHLISRRVRVIIEGLRQIGKHNLRYRIPLDHSTDEFAMIANSSVEWSSGIL